MNEPLEVQIVDRLSRLGARASLRAFREWFVPVSIDIEESGNALAVELVHHIDGILAEASSAGWSEADLCAELANAVRPLVENR